MLKFKRIFKYTLSLMFCSLVCVSCFEKEETDFTEYNDLIVTKITLGGLPRQLHTITKTGKDSIINSTYDAKGHTFAIDQLNNIAYNVDSLPYGVKADKILFSNFTVSGGSMTIRKVGSEQDTLYATADTLDYSQGFREFNLYGNDGVSRRTYRVEVRIHQQESDSVTWRQYPADEWDALSLMASHQGSDYSTDALAFSVDYPNVLCRPAGTDLTAIPATPDAIDTNERYNLPTEGMTWVTAPTRGDSRIEETILYGLNTLQPGTDDYETTPAKAVLWRRYYDTKGRFDGKWEYLSCEESNPNAVPVAYDATLLRYDQGYLLAGRTAEGSIVLKYSSDGGRTWKQHSALVLPDTLAKKEVKTLKAGIDAAKNVWLLIDNAELWYGRAHAVGWADTQNEYNQ